MGHTTRQQNTMNTTTLIILLGLACLVHGSVMVRQSDAVKDETNVADADADLGDGEEEESAIDDDKTNEDDKDKEGDKPDGPLPPVFCKAGSRSGKWGLARRVESATAKKDGHPKLSTKRTLSGVGLTVARAPATAVRSVAPNPVPALAKEWERNTVDLWRTETDPGVSMKRGTSLAGHGLKTKKRSRKQKLALLLTILLTAIRRMKTLCHCSKVYDSYDFFNLSYDIFSKNWETHLSF